MKHNFFLRLFKKRKADKNTGSKKFCPMCKIGEYTYKLDRHSAECWYMVCHNGENCTMFQAKDN